MTLNKFSKYLVVALITMGAATTVVAGDYKIGVVNSLQLMEQSPQANAMMAKLKKEFDPENRQIIDMQKKLKASQDRLTKDSAIMSEAERSKLEESIVNQRRLLKRKTDQFNDDYTFRRNEEVSKIQKQLIKAVQEVAHAQKFDIVLSDGVIFASPKVNITQTVIDYLNANAKKAASGN